MNRIGLYLLFTVLLASCQIKQNSSNDKIDPELKKELTQLNSAVLRAFQDNDAASLRPNCSAAFLTNTPNLIDFLEGVNFIDKPMEYPGPQHHHLVSALPKQANLVEYGNLNINFISAQKECYLMIQNFEGEEGAEYVLATCFTRGNNKKWKMDFLRYGVIRLNTMDAMQFYGQSIDFMSQGHLLDAALFTETLSGIYQPLLEVAQYSSNDQMEKHIKVVADTIASLYQFPMELSEVPGRPALWSVHLESMEGLLIPVVNYQTNTPVDKEPRIIAEIEEVHKAVAKIFKGFATNNPSIAYLANYGDPTQADIPIFLHFIHSGAQ